MRGWIEIGGGGGGGKGEVYRGGTCRDAGMLMFSGSLSPGAVVSIPSSHLTLGVMTNRRKRHVPQRCLAFSGFCLSEPLHQTLLIDHRSRLLSQ